MITGRNRDTSRLLMERSVPGRVGAVLPPCDVPFQDLPDAALLRGELDLPSIREAGWQYRQTWYPASRMLGIVEGVKA